MSRTEGNESSRIELTVEEKVVREQAFPRFLDWVFSFLADEEYFDSGRNVLQRSDRPDVDLGGERQHIEIAVRTWWEKRDWIKLFYMDFAKLHFSWPPSRGDWPGRVADIILAYEEGNPSKIARAHHALAEEYFYEGGLAFPYSVLNCDRSDACISECRKAVETQPANLEFRHSLVYFCNQFSQAFDAFAECLNMICVDPREAGKNTTGESAHFYLTNSNVVDPRRYYDRLTAAEKRKANEILDKAWSALPARNVRFLSTFGFRRDRLNLFSSRKKNKESTSRQTSQSHSTPYSEWPTFQGNNGRTGASSIALTPPLQALWEFDAQARLGCGPVISNGKVFVGTRDSEERGRLLAVDAESGRKLWEFATDGMITSHAAVQNGLVYFGSWDKKFHALEIETGKEVWHFDSAPQSSDPFDGIFLGNALVVNDKVVTQAEGLVILDAKTGKLVSQYRNPEYVGSSPCEDTGCIYVGLYRELAIIDLSRPDRVELFDFNQEKITSGPSIADGILLVGTNYGRVYAMDILSRKQVWMFEMKGKFRSEFQGATESCPAVGEGRVFFGCPDGNVYALEQQTGRLLWSFQTNSDISSSAVISGSVVYISSDRGDFYAFSVENGKLLWHYETLAAKWRIDDSPMVDRSSPAVCDGKVYVALDKLYAFAP